MVRYIVDNSQPYHASLHRPRTLGRKGLCSLHGCGEPAVMTMKARTESGRFVTLAVCSRGVHEYNIGHGT
jgi:hypothetical protein